MNNNSKRRKQRITALTLASTLLLGGCSAKHSSFELTENENNEIVAMEDSYIDNGYLYNYYVVEMYNHVTQEYEIYIVRVGSGITTKYLDVFTNYIIYDSAYSESLLELIKITRLKDYIVALGLEQLKYSYDDMKNIYEVIKENYVFENDNSLSRRRVIDSRI